MAGVRVAVLLVFLATASHVGASVVLLLPIDGSFVNAAAAQNLSISGTSSPSVLVTVTVTDFVTIVQQATTSNFAGDWTVFIDIHTLLDGSVTISAIETGNPTPVSRTVIKDTVSVVTTNYPGITQVSSTQVLWNIGGTGEVGATIQVRISDNFIQTPDTSGLVTVSSFGTWLIVLDVSLLSGSGLISVTQIDLAGNSGSDENRWNMPIPVILYPEEGSYINKAQSTAVDIRFGCGGATAYIVTITDISGTNSAFLYSTDGCLSDCLNNICPAIFWGKNITGDVSLLLDGPLTMVAYLDEPELGATLAESQPRTVYLDTVTFLTTITPSSTTSLLNLSGTGESGATLTITISDSVHPDIIRSFLVDSSEFWTTSINVNSLSDGTLSVSYRLVDRAGNPISENGSVLKYTPPPNDDCINAQELLSGNIMSSNEFAVGTDLSLNIVDPCSITGESTSTVWYYYDVLVPGVLTISTCNPGTNFDSIVAAYFGSCNGLVCVGSNNDGSSPSCLSNSGSELSVSASQVGRYYIMVSSFGSATGTISLSSSFTPSIIVGGDPHGFDFLGHPFELPLHQNSPGTYRLVEDHQMDVLCTVYQMFIREIQIEFVDLKSRFIAHINSTSGDPQFVWDSQIIDVPERFDFDGLLVESFNVDTSVIQNEPRGLNELSRYQIIGIHLGNKVTIVGGFHPHAGVFFNVQLSPECEIGLDRPSIANLLRLLPNRERNIGEWETLFNPALVM
jgi:hypothetical protein